MFQLFKEFLFLVTADILDGGRRHMFLKGEHSRYYI